MTRPEFTSPSERPIDHAERIGGYNFESNSATVSAGATETVVTHEAFSAERLEYATIATLPAADDVLIRLDVRDTDSGSYQMRNRNVANGPDADINLSPTQPVPEGEFVVVEVLNESGEEIDVHASVSTRVIDQ